MSAKDFPILPPNYELPPGLLGPVVSSPEPERLTLRDQFAMAALTGVVMDDNGTLVPRRIALAAYDIADAMMEARK